MLDNQNIEYSHWLSQSYKELEKLKEANERLASENKELKIEISNLKLLIFAFIFLHQVLQSLWP